MTEVPEDQVHDLERSADDMEEGLGKLEGHIETAHERAAEQRERANPEAAAGDWEEESTAAHQGDDATDASGSPGEEHGEGGGGDGGGSVAEAPVYEAEQVEPEGSGGESSRGEGSDDGD